MHAKQIRVGIGVFIAVSAGVLRIAPRLEERRIRGKQFVTVRRFEG
jgi:hypothetical protein